MDVYHGTTRARARRIFDLGLLPLPPSNKVWFAEDRAYAMGRARAQARRNRDAPRVLACNLDLDAIRREMGGKGVFYKKGIVAVDGPVTIEMLRSLSIADLATVPGEVVAWVNSLLGLTDEKAIQESHPGVVRLSNWINSHLASGKQAKLVSSELLERAKRWLPEYFRRARLSRKRLLAHDRIGLTGYEIEDKKRHPDARESEAFLCLESSQPNERARGLSLLADAQDPDLFDWCAMFLDDEAETVQLAALRAMRRCVDIVQDVIEPLAEAQDKNIRAAAIYMIVKHSADDAGSWLRKWLTDPEASVRAEASRFLNRLDPRKDRQLLVLASHDPNPHIAGKARDLLDRRRKRPERDDDGV